MAEKHKILVTRHLPHAVEERAVRDYDAVLNPDDRILSSDEMLDRAAGCEAILLTPTEPVTDAVLAALPDTVKMLATFSVGYDHIDLDAARRHGIAVSNTPDVLTDATADLTFLCLLGAARLAHPATTMLRTGNWTKWEPTGLLGVHVTGKRLGIFGMGRIGQALAQRARGFDMEIHYHNRSRLPADEEAGAIFHEDPEELLKLSDFISFNCPLTENTRKFLNARRISLLPENAVVVNTARGGIIDDEALIGALKSGRVAAAGLDVFDGEPNFNKGYLDLENTFLLPHIGSATTETRNAMGFMCLDNIDAWFAGAPLPARIA